MSWIPAVASAVSAGASAVSTGENMLDYQVALHNADVANTGGNVAPYTSAVEAAMPGYDQAIVNSAKSAGMSPLAMLGVNPASGPAASAGVAPPDDMGAALGELAHGIQGQDTSRAAAVALDAKQKMDEMDLQLKQAQIDKLHADASAERATALERVGNVGGPVGSPPPRPRVGGFSVDEATKAGFYGSGALSHVLQILDRIEEWGKGR